METRMDASENMKSTIAIQTSNLFSRHTPKGHEMLPFNDV